MSCPPFKGGQGRTDEELVSNAGAMLGLALLVSAFLIGVAVGWWLT